MIGILGIFNLRNLEQQVISKTQFLMCNSQKFITNFAFFPGLRFINCKSGKDRTGMAVTLEQTQILSREYDLAEHEYQKALDAMRRFVLFIYSLF